jgi:hypothetical protein
MLPPSPDLEEVLRWKEKYLSIGLLAKNVLIHPDSLPVDFPDRESYKLLYGTIYLGIPVGTPEFVTNALKLKIEALDREADIICKMDSAHGKFNILEKSFTKKIVHLQRLVSPDIMLPFSYLFERIVKRILDSIFGRVVSDHGWMQARLKMKNGGCGLGYQHDINIAACVASFEEVFVELKLRYPELDYTDCPLKDDVIVAEIFNIKAKLLTFESSRLFDIGLDRKNLQFQYNFKLNVDRMTRWRECLKSDWHISHTVRAINIDNVSSSDWLNCLPTSPDLQMNNFEF